MGPFHRVVGSKGRILTPSPAISAPPLARPPRPWRRALAWLVALGAFFYASYGFSNWLASQRDNVPSIVFAWERHIPFLAWTIVPYWSLNLFYALSLFLWPTKAALDRHAARLLTAQIVAVSFFLLLPLRFSFPAQATDGIPGFLFDSLHFFDKPFNQAPSLHIALTVILWAVYARLVRGSGRWFLHAWFALVGLSILTTYQHHFVDLPTGALLGALCLWVWPLSGPSPIQAPRLTRDPKRRRLAALYGAGALSLAFAPLAVIRPAMSAIDPAICANGWALWLLWPALSLLLVSFIYLAVGPTGFQKQDDGRLSPAATVLFLPYLIGTFINSRFWARHDPDASEVAPGVWLGRLPISLKGTPYTAILDLCAELPMPLRPGIRYRLTPLLDLAPPDPQILARGADFIASQRQLGPILVCCALGYGRSAAAVATWMVGNGLAPSAEAARAHLATLRPRVTLDAAALEAVHDGARIQV